jgi:hypothetical protein
MHPCNYCFENIDEIIIVVDLWKPDEGEREGGGN